MTNNEDQTLNLNVKDVDDSLNQNVKRRASPMAKPEVLRVVPLDVAREKKNVGRPKKLKMPAMPQGIFEGMTELEKEHFDYFVQCYREKYKIEEGTDLISLNLAAMDYIQTLRVQAKQFKEKEIISMARQHPAVQLRAWLDQMDVTRKANKGKNEKESEADKMRNDLLSLSRSS